jgi:hypothetical protein
MRWLLAVLVGAILIPGPTRADEPVLFRSAFETPPLHGFFEQFPVDPASWTLEFLPSGGWNGTGGAHIVHRANRRQYNLGWIAAPRRFGHVFRPGDVVYVRLRLRYDDDWRWDGRGSMQNKMVDFGIGGTHSRVILHQESPHPTTTCGIDPRDPRVQPSGTIGTLSVKRGITETCTPPVTIERGRWHHVQFAVHSSDSPTGGQFKLWVDTNDFAGPSSEAAGFPQTAEAWNDSWVVGGFMSDAPLRDQGFVIDDFEIGLTFDPGWSPR